MVGAGREYLQRKNQSLLESRCVDYTDNTADIGIGEGIKKRLY